ncbi:MAG: PAS domain S-box protein [Deltaproteobacteria bacterium]|nr:MAG: PAS domain S-box protein [Deltaproteobacteria bacterium]
MDLRRIHDISLKWKLLIPFLFLSFVGTTTLILLGLSTQRKIIENQEKKKLSDYYQAFSDQVEDRENSALSLALQVARAPAVQEAFFRRDRQALIDLLLPSYLVLKKEFGVRQFHFHIKPATSFLRLHRIYKSGEAMASFRHTINVVEESGRAIAGLERGTTGFAVRGVAPVFYQGEFIGTFEVGYSVEKPFLESLRSRYDMDLALLVPREGDKGFKQMAFSSASIPLLTDEIYRQVLQTQNAEVLVSPADEPDLAIFLGPLRDFSGKSIGVVEISVDRTATLETLAANRVEMFGVMVAALVFSAIVIVWVVTLFLRPIHDIVRVAREIAAGERIRGVYVPARDEIGALADSLNDMFEALKRARREIQNYCDTLEERVESRTWELVAEKEKFETLVENAPLIVYRLEPDGTTVFVNHFVEDILGHTVTEVIDDRDFWTKTAHPEDRQNVAEQLAACLGEGREFLVEYRGIHNSGLEVFLLNHAIPLIDQQGRVQAVDGIIVDVSERKRLEEKIIQTEELKTLSNISARLAHEIRNPLTSAGGFARRLLKEMDQKDAHRSKVEIIVKEVGRLEHILKMILSYIRPLTLEFTDVDLNKVLQEVISGSEDKLGSQGIKLDMQLDEELPFIRADRSHLRNALETIVKNACSHMPEQSCLRVSTTYDGAAVVQLSYPALHVADDDMEHFFYPFVSDKLGEADLQVPLTKMVIHKHGGIINITRDEQNQVVITIIFSSILHRPDA